MRAGVNFAGCVVVGFGGRVVERVAEQVVEWVAERAERAERHKEGVGMSIGTGIASVADVGMSCVHAV